MYGCKHSLAKTLFKEGKFLGNSATQKRPTTLGTQFKASIAGAYVYACMWHVCMGI